MPAERLAEKLAPGRVFAGDRQLVERPGQRQRREPPSDGEDGQEPQGRAGAQALQLVDDCERRAGRDGPERRPERDPRRRADGGGDGAGGVSRRGQGREQQKCGQQRRRRLHRLARRQ